MRAYHIVFLWLFSMPVLSMNIFQVVKGKHGKFYEAITAKDYEALRNFLTKKGKKILEIRRGNLLLPLGIAIEINDREMVNFLILQGADVNGKNNLLVNIENIIGRSHVALAIERNHFYIAEDLISYGGKLASGEEHLLSAYNVAKQRSLERNIP